jgi:hypothetical protein
MMNRSFSGGMPVRDAKIRLSAARVATERTLSSCLLNRTTFKRSPSLNNAKSRLDKGTFMFSLSSHTSVPAGTVSGSGNGCN